MGNTDQRPFATRTVQQKQRLIERNLHVFEWYWNEAIEEDGPRVQLWFAVRRDKLADEVRAH